MFEWLHDLLRFTAVQTLVSLSTTSPQKPTASFSSLISLRRQSHQSITTSSSSSSASASSTSSVEFESVQYNDVQEETRTKPHSIKRQLFPSISPPISLTDTSSTSESIPASSEAPIPLSEPPSPFLSVFNLGEDARGEILKWQARVAEDLADMIKVVNKLATENSTLKDFINYNTPKS
jgi:hypothetical protein